MAKIVKRKDTRREFIRTLNELNDQRIVVLYPDVGFLYLDQPGNKFKSINTGVTESATMAMAAGLALEGFKPYVYTMLNFSVFRPFEMVRNCVALHKADVKIIGVKGSEAYKFLGFSHNMVFDDEDFYHLKPYMECHAPPVDEVEKVIIDTFKSNKPAYIRL